MIENGKIKVFFQDECHLLWSNVVGYTWLKKNVRTEIEMKNPKTRKTCYGILSVNDNTFHSKFYDRGNTSNTIKFMEYIETLYPDTQIWWIWDGASYHTSKEMQEFLTKKNKDLEEENWKHTCLLLAPNAPEQNPVENVWAKAKKHIRTLFHENKTFKDVTDCFSKYLKDNCFNFEKMEWYYKPNLQLN